MRQREPVTLRVRLLARAATKARLQLATAGEVVFDRSVELVAGHNEFPVELRFKRAGASELQVKLAAPGEAADTWLGSVWVGPRLRLVHVEGDAIGAGYLADALASQGIEVQRVTPEQFAQDSAARCAAPTPWC